MFIYKCILLKHISEFAHGVQQRINEFNLKKTCKTNKGQAQKCDGVIPLDNIN